MPDKTIDSLAIFTEAALLLAEANTIQKAKELKDMAITAKEWARRKGMGEEAVRHCQSYSRRAEIRMGEMLLVTERSKPGPDKKDQLPDATDPPTLKELGISKRESSEAQMLAGQSGESQEEYIASKTTKVKIRQAVKSKEIIKQVSLPDAKFRVIYADPPWQYNDKCEGGGVQSLPTECHYPTMKLDDICEMEIKSICEDNAVLFLWVTSPMLTEGLQVVGAWGFKYKAAFIWDKIKHNMGHYNSVRHELLLICTRGSCQPDVKKQIDSVQSIERTKHSAKPAEFYEIIETLYPHGKKIELFARAEREGWDRYGHQA